MSRMTTDLEALAAEVIAENEAQGMSLEDIAAQVVAENSAPGDMMMQSASVGSTSGAIGGAVLGAPPIQRGSGMAYGGYLPGQVSPRDAYAAAQPPTVSLMPGGDGQIANIVRGLDRGVNVAGTQIGGAMAAAGNFLPGSFGRQLVNEGEDYAVQQALLRDQTAPTTTFLGGVAEAVPGLAGAVGAGVVTGGVAPAAGLGAGLVGTAVGAGVAGAQSGGGQYVDAMDRLQARGIVGDTARDQAAASAAGTGAVSAVTSVIPMGRYLSRFIPAPVASGVVGRIAKTRAGRIVLDAAAEGSQEAVEEIGSMVAQDLAENDPNAYNEFAPRLAQAFGAGAVLGGVVGGAMDVATGGGPEARARQAAAMRARGTPETPAPAGDTTPTAPQDSGVSSPSPVSPPPATPNVADATPDVAAPEAPTLTPEAVARIEYLYDELSNRPDMPEAERLAMEAEMRQLTGEDTNADATQPNPVEPAPVPVAAVEPGAVAGDGGASAPQAPVAGGGVAPVLDDGVDAARNPNTAATAARPADVMAAGVTDLTGAELRARAREFGVDDRGPISVVRRRVQNAERAGASGSFPGVSPSGEVAASAARQSGGPQSGPQTAANAQTVRPLLPQGSGPSMPPAEAPRNTTGATSNRPATDATTQARPETPRTPQTPPVAQGSASQNPTPTGSQYAISSPKGYHLTARNKSVISQMLAQGAKSAKSGNTRYDIEGDGPNYTVRITTREANDRGQVQNRERATPFVATRRGSAAPSAPVPPTPAQVPAPAPAQSPATSPQSPTQGESATAATGTATGGLALDEQGSDPEIARVARELRAPVRAVAPKTPRQRQLAERLGKLGTRVVIVDDPTKSFKGFAGNSRERRSVYIASDIDDAKLASVFSHEVFHSLVRQNPTFRDEIAGILGEERVARGERDYRAELEASSLGGGSVLEAFDRDADLRREEGIAKVLEDAAAGDAEAARLLYENPTIFRRLLQLWNEFLDRMGIERGTPERRALMQLLNRIGVNGERAAERSVAWAQSKGGTTMEVRRRFAKTPEYEMGVNARDVATMQTDDWSGSMERMFSFPGKLPTDIRELLEGQPIQLRRMFQENSSNGRGADAFAQLGADRYMEIARAEAGLGDKGEQIDALRNNPDPENQYVAATAQAARETGRNTTKVPIAANALQPGDVFRVNGKPVRVLRDENERMVLVGRPFRGILVEGLTTIPIDTGTHYREGSRGNVQTVQEMGGEAADVPSESSGFARDADVPFSPRGGDDVRPLRITQQGSVFRNYEHVRQFYTSRGDTVTQTQSGLAMVRHKTGATTTYAETDTRNREWMQYESTPARGLSGSMFDRTDDAKGTGNDQGSLFGIPANARATTPPKLTLAERRELYPGIKPNETVAAYEKRMGTADTPTMFSPLPPTIDVDGQQRSTTNSDGKQIAQDEASVQNFWRWFKGSAATDSNGRPLVVYHGTPDGRFLKQTGVFQSQRERIGMGQGAAFWFATSRATASTYANPNRAWDYQNAEPQVVAAYIRLENPLTVDAAGQEWRQAQARGRTSDVIEQAQANGHDGALIRNVRDDYNNAKGTRPTTTFTVFASGQIKAVDNAGTFDPANPDIRFAPRGMSRIEQRNQERADRKIASLEKKVDATKATEKARREAEKQSALVRIGMLRNALAKSDRLADKLNTVASRLAVDKVVLLDKLADVKATNAAKLDVERETARKRLEEYKSGAQERYQNLKTRAAQHAADVQFVKEELVDMVKALVPADRRGEFLTAVANVRGPISFANLTSRIVDASLQGQARDLASKAKRITGADIKRLGDDAYLARQFKSGRMRFISNLAFDTKGKASIGGDVPAPGRVSEQSPRQMMRDAIARFVSAGERFDNAKSLTEKSDALISLNAAHVDMARLMHEALTGNKLMRKGAIRGAVAAADAIRNGMSTLAAKTAVRRAGEYVPARARRALMATTEINTIAAMMHGKIEGSPFYENVIRPLKVAEAKYRERYNSITERDDEAARAAGFSNLNDVRVKLGGLLGDASEVKYKLAQSINLPGLDGVREIPAKLALDAYATDPETLATILAGRPVHIGEQLSLDEGMTVSAETYQIIIDAIPDEHKEFVDAVKAHANEHFAEMATVVKALTGTEPEAVYRQHPRTINPEWRKQFAKDDAAMESPTGFVQASLENSSLAKSRVSDTAPLVWGDFFAKHYQKVDTMARIIEMAKPVRDAKMILRDGELSAELKNKVHPKAKARIEKWLTEKAGMNVNPMDRKGALPAVQRMVVQAARNTGQAMTGLFTSSWLRNLAGIPMLTADMPYRVWAKGLANMFSRKWSEMIAKSVYIKHNFGMGFYDQKGQSYVDMPSLNTKGGFVDQMRTGGVATGQNAKQAVRELWRATSQMTGGITFRDRAKLKEAFRSLGGMVEATADMFTKSVPAMFDGVNILGWWAGLSARVAYNGWMQEAMDIKASRGWTDEQAEAWAIEQAERTLEQTQGSNQTDTRSELHSEVRGTMLQPMFMFQNDSYRAWNTLTQSLLTGDTKRASKTLAAWTLGALLGGAVSAYWAPWAWLFGLDDDEKDREKKNERFIATTARDFFGIIPGGDRLVEAGAAVVNNLPGRTPTEALIGTPPAAMLDALVSGFAQLIRGIEEGVTGDDGVGNSAAENTIKGAGGVVVAGGALLRVPGLNELRRFLTAWYESQQE